MTEPTLARVVVIEAHAIPARPALNLTAGDLVTVGEHDDEWPTFVFVRAACGSGWVPVRHLSVGTGRATVITSYDTTELGTTIGEVLEVVVRDDESGWLWCRNADGREGWVPTRTLRAAREPE